MYRRRGRHVNDHATAHGKKARVYRYLHEAGTDDAAAGRSSNTT
jgi:hypothetical protein